VKALPRIAQVALDLPDIGQSDGFDYQIPDDLADRLRLGSWVVVPWIKTQKVGLVVAVQAHSELAPQRLKPVLSLIEDAPAPDAQWFRLLRFAAGYYHRSLGEVALPALPKLFRTPPRGKKVDGSERESIFGRSRRRYASLAKRSVEFTIPELTVRQAEVIACLPLAGPFQVQLLYGVTGSGKTEIYLRWIAAHLARSPLAQALLLVPEINLTPQLLARVTERFSGVMVAVLHSDLPDARRAADWLAAAEGHARIVIGTRLSILAPLPNLAAIVVDEEHDPSYKQQDGVRYSARDLAIIRAQQANIPVLLASATPSLETWHAASRGRYRMQVIEERATGTQLPLIRLVSTRKLTMRHSLSEPAIDAIRAAVARGEQALVFINRRGYSPVLSCESCGWTSQCENCSAHRVLHRRAQASPLGARLATGNRRTLFRLVCHHCSAEQPVPRACPSCGNVDLKPLGRGTQRLEEGLAELFPGARIARLDRDVARRRNAAQAVLDAAQAGEIDILVGTQMLAKGHDFDGLAVVVVVDPDNGLYAADFRAPERLFATLMQVAGRAGRSTLQKGRAEVIIQTRYPDHPLFEALIRHDFRGFAAAQLSERQQAGLPPFVHQALLRAEASELAQAIAWLSMARQLANAELLAGAVTLFDPVPLALVRVADVERAQLLIESRSRTALHQFLDRWLPLLKSARPASASLRWQLEVDPIEI
jgi:primosomal protein N' (replication factor Y) (superfamily II helicase)